VASLTLTVVAPDLPPEKVAALRAVVAHCTVSNSLTRPPETELRVIHSSPEGARGPLET
jgi:hypothetical protein